MGEPGAPRKERAAQRSEQRSDGAAAPLVNTTKSVAASRVVICPETGVVTSFRRFPGRDEHVEIRDPGEARFERWLPHPGTARLPMNRRGPAMLGLVLGVLGAAHMLHDPAHFLGAFLDVLR